MKGREDLLVCFPSRSRLTLIPKPFCSPARPAESKKCYHRHHHHHAKKSGTGVVPASPLSWSRPKSMGLADIAEPGSPKVTCAGQIKVRPKAGSCKTWQSVMEEIEKIHDNKKNSKRPSWAEAMGLKKDTVQFLACLRNIRLDFRCFSSIHKSAVTTGGEEEEGIREEEISSSTMFSKWFMVLQESQSNWFCRENREERIVPRVDVSVTENPVPPNALLLMRCRSAPDKTWARRREAKEEQALEKKDGIDEEEVDRGMEVKKSRSLRALMEEEDRKISVLVKYEPDFPKIQMDSSKERWVFDGTGRDSLFRSRSWKR